MDPINKLIKIFRSFPTVGQRTAGRFVYYLLKQPQENINELILSINELRKSIKLCRSCFYPFQSETSQICAVCSNPSRDRNLLCVIEKETDLLALENTKKYNGLYFILGGTVATMEKDNLAGLRIAEFRKRVMTEKFSEIVIALNSTPEGIATSSMIERIIKEPAGSRQPKITHLAKGIPVGGELEYIDEETLESAITGRK